MDIYLTEIGNKNSIFRFPVMPEKISIRGRAKYQTYDMINGKTHKLPKGKECDEVSWDGVFFGPARKNCSFIREYIPPKKCEIQLKRWRDRGTPLRLMITETTVNMDVTISDFDTDLEGGYSDVAYVIVFCQYIDLKVYTTKEKKKPSVKAKKKKTKSRPANKAKGGALYVVKSGDCLWNIAKQHLKDSLRWPEIYKMNKEVIESTAKKYGHSSSSNGHWIFPGTKLKLPAA